MHIYDYISVSSSLNDKYFSENFQRKTKRTFYVEELFPENRAVYEITWKIIVK
jgi:hypothetical protein